MKNTFLHYALHIVLSAAVLSTCASCSASDPETSQDTPEPETDQIADLISTMSLEEKIGQMLTVSYRTWKQTPEDEGMKITHVTDEVRKSLSEVHPGGVILFAENCQENEQIAQLLGEMNEAVKDSDGSVHIPLLFSIDQEGGVIARLTKGTSGIGNMALAATGDPENAYREAQTIASELSALSINADFAPVMDINSNPANPVIGIRSFSDDPDTVSEYGMQFLKGLQDGGVISTLKHFPGHGDTDTDSHTGLPKVDRSYEELKERELIPFQAMIDAGADMIMTAHIQYPQIEKETYTSVSTGETVYLPATMSKTILTDILRRDMGFEGVIVTDSLDMDAIKEHYDYDDVCRKTIEAGVDILLVSSEVTDPAYLEKISHTVSYIASLVSDGTIPESRIDESVTRILKLKKKYGLLSFDETERSSDLSIIGSEAGHEAEWKMAQQAVTMLKNDDVIPFKAEDHRKILLVFSHSSRLVNAEFARKRLIAEKIISESVTFEAVAADADAQQECLKKASEADLVILVSTIFSADAMNPQNNTASAIFDRVIDAAHRSGTKTVMISSYLPYDTARYQNADAILASYGSVPIYVLPENGETYLANLPAAICAVFGESEPGGSLPVDIPALNSRYEFTDEILYPRGFRAEN